MPRFFFPSCDRPTCERSVSRSSVDPVRLATLALSIIVMAGGLLSARPGLLQAGEQPPAASPGNAAGFLSVACSREALMKVHEDLVKLAQDDLAQAQPRMKEARQRLANIKQTRGGSTSDLVNVWNHELHTAVETAKADELVKQARMELEKAKLKKLEEPFQNREIPIREGRILTLLDKANPIDERFHMKLTQAETDGAAGDALRKEVADLTREFQALIERALAEEAAAAWARLKPGIHQAASQSAATPPK